MADKTNIPDFPTIPDVESMIRQACAVIANVRGIPYDFNGTLSLENKFTVLFKTVKEMFDVQESLIESFKELYEFCKQFLTDASLKKAVTEVLKEMKESGELEELMNNILANAVKFNSSKYAVYLHTEKIIDTKINDIAQGFCTDGEFFYMLHHVSDAQPLKLLKMTLTGDVVSDSILYYTDDSVVNNIHGNSLCAYKGYLYAAFAGDNTHNILKINMQTFKCEKLTTTLTLSSFGLFEVENMTFAANVVSRSEGIALSYVENGKMIPFTRFVPTNTVPNLKQGLLVTSTHLYLPYSALYMYHYNMIRVYTHGLQNTIDIQLLEYADKEMEDLARIAGKEVIYWNDSDGNVYSINTTGVIGQSRETTSLSAYEQALPEYMVSVNEGTKEINDIYTSNGISVTRSWNLPTCYHRTWSGSVYGAMEVLGAWTPAVVSPWTGAMFINGSTHLWDGSKYVPIFYRLQYDFTGDNQTIGSRTMKLKAFLFSAGGTDYVYTANATDSEINKATKWLKDKFGNTIQYITRYGYWVYNTTLNAGSVSPMRL